MKSMIFAAALALASTVVTADVLRPGKSDFQNFTGNEAKEMYNAKGGKTVPGDSLRTSFSTYKVWRANDGQQQTVCRKTGYRAPANKKPSYSCTIETSLDGHVIPEFNPPRRLG